MCGDAVTIRPLGNCLGYRLKFGVIAGPPRPLEKQFRIYHAVAFAELNTKFYSNGLSETAFGDFGCHLIHAVHAT